MKKECGIYFTTKKDKTPYYRVSITFQRKHISLGSFMDKQDAQNAYWEAKTILSDASLLPDEYTPRFLKFEKCITLMNFRDHGIYIKNPIYIMPRFFYYYYSKETVYTFDIDDLFYYANHKIMKRGRHLFVADYGMQVNILSRYGIRSHAVKGRDYEFINGDDKDYRYHNIRIINRYYGVEAIKKNGRTSYRSRIHINGNYIIGSYSSETEAAIAYNKAVALLREKGCRTAYPENYLEDISAIEYAKLYNNVKLSKRFREYLSTCC